VIALSKKSLYEYEYTKGVMGTRKLKKNWQYNAQKKKEKRQNYDLQNTKQKTKD
jgi:hypothetical protein